jgi:hypothetical protein
MKGQTAALCIKAKNNQIKGLLGIGILDMTYRNSEINNYKSLKANLGDRLELEARTVRVSTNDVEPITSNIPARRNASSINNQHDKQFNSRSYAHIRFDFLSKKNEYPKTGGPRRKASGSSYSLGADGEGDESGVVACEEVLPAGLEPRPLLPLRQLLEPRRLQLPLRLIFGPPEGNSKKPIEFSSRPLPTNKRGERDRARTDGVESGGRGVEEVNEAGGDVDGGHGWRVPADGCGN